MGKLAGIIKIEGTLDGLTFYKSQDGYMVRTKGGVSKKRIMTDPAFARTRENLSEFALNAKSGKLIRDATGVILNRAKDPKLSSRMLQLMNTIKNFDAVSARGKRNVAAGIASEEGKQLLKGFDFNIKAPLASVLQASFTVATDTGTIAITDFIPLEQLSTPNSATHVSFRSAFINLDFATGLFDKSYSPISNVLLDQNLITVTLTPEQVPAGSGIQLYLLLIEFYQDVNGIQYPLRSGNYNALNLVEIF
ncbi:hypothetical protein IWX83_002787 [Flavobacterium sp. CG_9.1]|uniref:hypothetical protein n=1 Tax=Flavobacterium sp. CG_9.1 TaxID=2787728 RepID=UPI0018CAE212|nr:hypothetical protein [Flavobacterium sp. CG_9.1]MBG6062980.1 hypothetical protein [Flavobacterium sp. CG_9.1]